MPDLTNCPNHARFVRKVFIFIDYYLAIFASKLKGRRVFSGFLTKKHKNCVSLFTHTMLYHFLNLILGFFMNSFQKFQSSFNIFYVHFSNKVILNVKFLFDILRYSSINGNKGTILLLLLRWNFSLKFYRPNLNSCSLLISILILVVENDEKICSKHSKFSVAFMRSWDSLYNENCLTWERKSSFYI